MAEKRALFFPKWVEALLVVIMLALAVVEFWHDQWGWALMFGTAGALFGASFAARLLTGDQHGGE